MDNGGPDIIISISKSVLRAHSDIFFSNTFPLVHYLFYWIATVECQVRSIVFLPGNEMTSHSENLLQSLTIGIQAVKLHLKLFLCANSTQTTFYGDIQQWTDYVIFVAQRQISLSGMWREKKKGKQT